MWTGTDAEHGRGGREVAGECVCCDVCWSWCVLMTGYGLVRACNCASDACLSMCWIGCGAQHRLLSLLDVWHWVDACSWLQCVHWTVPRHRILNCAARVLLATRRCSE